MILGLMESAPLGMRTLGFHVTGVAASAWHGADWVDNHEPIEILVHERRKQAGLLVRMDRVADDEVIVSDGVRVATRARTAFDLGRYQKRAAGRSFG